MNFGRLHICLSEKKDSINLEFRRSSIYLVNHKSILKPYKTISIGITMQSDEKSRHNNL